MSFPVPRCAAGKSARARPSLLPVKMAASVTTSAYDAAVAAAVAAAVPRVPRTGSTATEATEAAAAVLRHMAGSEAQPSDGAMPPHEAPTAVTTNGPNFDDKYHKVITVLDLIEDSDQFLEVS